MARHSNRVRVYSAQLDVLCGRPRYLRSIPRGEAIAMIDAGEAFKIDPAKHQVTAIRLTSLLAEQRFSPTSLTCSVMEANAGIHGKSVTTLMSEMEKLERELAGKFTEDFVEAAIAKVDFWPVIGDTKAVRVAPRV